MIEYIEYSIILPSLRAIISKIFYQHMYHPGIDEQDLLSLSMKI